MPPGWWQDAQWLLTMREISRLQVIEVVIMSCPCASRQIKSRSKPRRINTLIIGLI